MQGTVHDNWLYAHVVDHERSVIVLHTVYPHGELPEFVDVVFDGVILHHLEQQSVGGGDVPANVLFDVEEAHPRTVLARYEQLMERTRRFGWPFADFIDVGDLAQRLASTGAKCFEVSATCGLDGFVFAREMTLRLRESRANVVAPGTIVDSHANE